MSPIAFLSAYFTVFTIAKLYIVEGSHLFEQCQWFDSRVWCTAKSITELLKFFARHIWWWIPTNSYRFLQWRHIFLRGQRRGYQVSHSLLNVVANMAESEGNLASVDSAGSNSLEVVASTSNASESRRNVRHSFPLLTFSSQNSHQMSVLMYTLKGLINMYARNFRNR